MMNDGPQTPAELDAIEDKQLEDIVRLMVDKAGVIMEDTFSVAGVEFTISAVDSGESEEAMREVGRDDLVTREISYQRAILKRAITRINGQRAKPSTIDLFLRKSPPAMVRCLYDRFLAIRQDHALKFEAVQDIVRK